MKSFRASFALVVTAWAFGATAAAQVPAPPSPQTAPPVTAPPPARRDGPAPTPAAAPRTNATAADFGPIIATGTSAAYVSAESAGHPGVFIGSDASPYGIMGTFSNHPLGFRTNNIPRLFIDTSGNVGIGTTGPGYKLDVSGDANITGTYRVNGLPISATANWTQAGNAIYYTTGNVGIGTTTPAQNLEVNGIASLGPPGSVYGYLVDGVSPGPYPTLGFNAYGPTYRAGIAGYGGIFQFQDGNGSLIYYTGSSVSAGQPGVYTPRMTIRADGQVGIGNAPTGFSILGVDGGVGATAVYGVSVIAEGVSGRSTSSFGVYGNSSSNSGLYGLSTSGSGVSGRSSSGDGVFGYSDSGYAGFFSGDVYISGTVCAANVSCASDVRLKQDITPLSYGLREVLQLRPVRWQWKDTTTTQLNLGLVAQDVDPVLPELVLRNVDTQGSLGLNYFGLVPVMINAIREQQDTISRLETANANLAARLTALEQTLRHVVAQATERH